MIQGFFIMTLEQKIEQLKSLSRGDIWLTIDIQMILYSDVQDVLFFCFIVFQIQYYSRKKKKIYINLLSQSNYSYSFCSLHRDKDHLLSCLAYCGRLKEANKNINWFFINKKKNNNRLDFFVSDGNHLTDECRRK